MIKIVNGWINLENVHSINFLNNPDNYIILNFKTNSRPC